MLHVWLDSLTSSRPHPQVLDGAPIDAAEQAAAKAKYSGRLTLDFLEQVRALQPLSQAGGCQATLTAHFG
jgi:hypothetical protein